MSNKSFKFFLHRCGEVRTGGSNFIIRNVIKNCLSTGCHVLKYNIKGFVTFGFIVTAINHLQCTPSCPVVAVCGTWVLHSDGELTVLANVCNSISLIAVYFCSDSHTGWTLNNITNKTIFSTSREAVFIDRKVISTCNSEITVFAINSFIHGNHTLNSSGEVVEYFVSIDTGSIVGAVAVVAGTEASVYTYQIVTRLHTLNSLIHITCSVPALNTIEGLAVIVLNLSICRTPGIGPAFCLLAEVAIGNQTADICSRDITTFDSILQPLGNTICLSLDFISCCCVLLNNVKISSERILFGWLIIFIEVSLQTIPKLSGKCLVLVQICLNIRTLVDVSLINSSILINSILCSRNSIQSVCQFADSCNITYSFNRFLKLVNQSLSSNYIYKSIFCFTLNSSCYYSDVCFGKHRVILTSSIDNDTVIVEWIRMLILFEGLIPCWVAELLSVQLIAESTIGNFLKINRINLAVFCHSSVMLLFARINVLNISFIAVGNLCTTASEGVTIVNT